MCERDLSGYVEWRREVLLDADNRSKGAGSLPIDQTKCSASRILQFSVRAFVLLLLPSRTEPKGGPR